jgi:hypothetical protein
MDKAQAVALALSVLLLLLGLGTGWKQVANLRRLGREKHLPSDDRRHFGRQARRRLVVSILLVVIANMIAGTYLSGMEQRANEIAERPKPEAVEGADPVQQLNPEDRQFARVWGVYWIVIITLLLVVVGLAMLDLLATRRYGMEQYRRIRDDHRVKLERDLALYKQQRGGRFGSRLASDD